MEYRFTANLRPFTGENITIEDNCFKRIYKIVMSEARAAGCNLSRLKYVVILDRKTLAKTFIINHDGYIVVSACGHEPLRRYPREAQ